MARHDRSPSGEEIYWWHLLAHGIAFCVAAAIGAILLYPLYPRFEAQTDTAGEAFGAFLTCCVIAGGFGPMISLFVLWLYGFGARTRRSRIQSDRFEIHQNFP
jgi:ABC-type Fe3+ transport system permease subunit